MERSQAATPAEEEAQKLEMLLQEVTATLALLLMLLIVLDCVVILISFDL